MGGARSQRAVVADSDRERLRRRFLEFVRPALVGAALVAFALFEAISPSEQVRDLLVLLLVSLAASGVYVVLARTGDLRRVTAGVTIVDTILIAAMTAAMDRPWEFTSAYVWSIGIAAFLVGPRWVVVTTAAAAAASVVVPALAHDDPSWVAVVTGALVLALVGAIMSTLADAVQRSQEELAAEHAVETAALRITERARSSLDLRDAVAGTLEELGRATGAGRALFRLTDRNVPTYQWTRDGFSPARIVDVPTSVQRVSASAEPLVVNDRRTLEDVELRAYLEDVGAESMVGFPIFVGHDVRAVIGLHDDVPRRWGEDVVPLLARISAPLGAAIAQAEAFARVTELARMREEVIATVSHELRTPITAILGMLRTVERPDLRGVDRTELLGVARGEAERLASLVEDLLTLARLDRSALPLQRADVPLRDIVDRATRPLQAGDDRCVRNHVEPALIVNVDAERIVQVVSNLVQNALVHGAGDVEIDASASDGVVSLAVSDDGAVAPEYTEHLFTPFSRASEESVGSGLGLPIARAIAETHGGKLYYRPRGDGERHAFVVELPR